MNGKKAKALRKLARQNAQRAPGYQSGTPKGHVIKERNPKFIVGVANGEPEFHAVLHTGTMRHKPATYGSIYRKLKQMSKQPGHYFSMGDQHVSVRQFLDFQRLLGKGGV